MTVQAERLRALAVSRSRGASRIDGPVEVELAKRRLRHEGDCLQADLDRFWLPLARAANGHPWRTLSIATGSGATAAWLDDVSGGRLHRLALQGLWPLWRTLIARSSLKGL